MAKKIRKVYSSVDELFKTDDLGIFDDIKVDKPTSTTDVIGLSKFDEINTFLDNHKRKPSFDSKEVSERSLARRLQAYREDMELWRPVVDYDRYGLLDGFINSREVDVTSLVEESPVGVSKTTESDDSVEKIEPIVRSELRELETKVEKLLQGVRNLPSAENKVSENLVNRLNILSQEWLSFFEGEWKPYHKRVLELLTTLHEIGHAIDKSATEIINDEDDVLTISEVDVLRRYSTRYSRREAWATRNPLKRSYHNDLIIDQLNDRAFETGFNFGDFISGRRFRKSEKPKVKATEAESKAVEVDSSRANTPDKPARPKSESNEAKPVKTANDFKEQTQKAQTTQERGLFDEFKFELGSEDYGVQADSKDGKKADEEKPKSLEDILADDDLGIFDDIDVDLFDVPLELQDPRTRTFGEDDLIGERKPCANFDEYKPTFDVISKHLANGNYNRHDVIRESSINIGSVFVINNMVAYVADKYLAEDREDKSKRNERLKLVFANGTESNMLAFSLTLVPYKYDNTYQVEITDPAWIDAHFSKSFMGDSETKLKEPDGYIYAVRLKERPDELYHYKDLHKIGLTHSSGEIRTKGSINDATFLHREVELAGEWAIRNADIYKVEQLIHRFLKEAKVSMKVATNNDRLHGANEWFDVPIHEIEKVINLVVSGDIVDYRYDPYRKKVVFK